MVDVRSTVVMCYIKSDEPEGRSVLFVEGHVVLVGMVAAGAYAWGLGAFEDVAAYEAAPADGVVAFPYGAFLHHLEIAGEAVEMVLFGLGDGQEMFGYLGEAFLLSHAGGLFVAFHSGVGFLAH